jgi:hypothetical protein
MLTEDQEKDIRQIIFSFEEYGLGDIKKSLNQNMLIATFILCVCFVESMIQYRFYKEKHERGDSSKNWESFVNIYFSNQYQGMGKSLCENLRNKIVHNYSGNNVYALGDDSDLNTATHLEKLKDGRIFLNVSDFACAVGFAFDKYKKDLSSLDELKLLALQHLIKYPIFKKQSG